jgi:putative restriction endonuclease
MALQRAAIRHWTRLGRQGAVNLYVGITDYDWFRFLSALQSVEEVNFWQPGGRTNFRALRSGELFLFKLHAPRNFIVGGGVFARAEILPTSIAWEAFGPSNGAVSLSEMRERIARYREQEDDLRQDYMIGCRILTQPFFFPDNEWIPIPESWSRHIQQGRTYDAAVGDGKRLWELVMDRVATRADAPISVPRYGEPVLIRPRLGQGAFRVGVTGVYQRRCAVTGERTLPILDAAHIRPYGDDGDHEITNGLLLRTDVHRLFDLGYVTVTNDGHFEVGRRLKEDFENGRHYYAMHGKPITLPKDADERPARHALEWHQTPSSLAERHAS